MPHVTFVLVDGSRKTLDVPIGQSLMLAAKAVGIEDIVAECGGGLTCASCHVIVDEADVKRCPELRPSEDQMLDFVVAERMPTSRLSCQLVMNQEMDGIVVRIACPQV